MKQKIKAALLFDTSNISDLDSIRLHIAEDNRRFATIWAIVQFIYGAFCLFMSFYQENYRKCRYIYLTRPNRSKTGCSRHLHAFLLRGRKHQSPLHDNKAGFDYSVELRVFLCYNTKRKKERSGKQKESQR